MKTRRTWLVIVVASILQLVGIALFARGFFPYKKVLPGFAMENGPQDFLDLGLQPVGRPQNLFDRLIFIVIDALRRYWALSIVCLMSVTLCSLPTLQCRSYISRPTLSSG